MKSRYQSTLLAAAVATLIASPSWAATETPDQQAAPATDMQQTSRPMQAPATDQALPSQGASDRQQPLNQATPSTSQDAPKTASTDNPVLQLTPAQMDGMEVVDPNGEKVGKVKDVVRSRDEENIQAVIASGGILGFGAKKVTVPIDQLKMANDKLQINASKEELSTRRDYKPDAFVDLQPSNKPISEFSAFEPIPDQKTTPAPDNSAPQDETAPQGGTTDQGGQY